MKLTPDKITDYVESFFHWNQPRGKIVRINEYGSSMIIHFEDGSKAKITIGLWQGEPIVHDETANIKKSEL